MDGQQVTVAGYVPTEENRLALMRALEPVRRQVIIRVWSSELLRSSIEQALAGMRVPLEIAELDGGDVVLQGGLAGPSDPDDIRSDLLRDVSGITNLELQIVDLNDAEVWLRGQVRAADMPTDALTLDNRGSELVVTGTLATAFADAWSKIVQDFDQRYAPELAIENRVTLADPVAAAPETLASFEASEQAAEAGGAEITGTDGFDFVVRAISAGPPAFVTLGTDEKYLVGSRFPNGMVLDRIDPDGIVLSDDGTRHLVRIAPDSGRVSEVQRLASE
jgi:hypothetical protein